MGSIEDRKPVVLFCSVLLLITVTIGLPFSSGIEGPENQIVPEIGPGNPGIDLPGELPFPIGERAAQENYPPLIQSITINANEEITDLTDGDELVIEEDEAYIIFFTGNAIDESTVQTRLIWEWTVTVPSGYSFQKSFRSFDMEILETGTYNITLVVSDDEGGVSAPVSVTLVVEEEAEVDPPCFSVMVVPVSSVLMILLGAILNLKRTN
ncbi:MAG: hypothetical protein ACMUHY_05315 [Thermoplasmatota archaeon]